MNKLMYVAIAGTALLCGCACQNCCDLESRVAALEQAGAARAEARAKTMAARKDRPAVKAARPLAAPKAGIASDPALRTAAQVRFAAPKIVDQWRKYHDAMYMAAAAKKDKFVIQFRSGRRKIYFNPRIIREVKTQYDEKGVAHPRVTEALQAVTVLGKPAKFFTGGNIMENVVQGTCRDLMNFAAVEIEEKHPTWRFVLSVYDEVVFEVPDAETAEAEKAIPEIMCRGDYIRDWTEGLPLEVEGCVSDRYVK